MQRLPKNPAELLHLWDVVDSTIITTHGVFIRGLKIEGLDSEHMPSEQLISASNSLYSDLAGLVPENVMCQVIMESHGNYDDVFDEYERVPAPGNKVLDLQRRRRMAFLRKSNLRRHTLYLFYGFTKGFSKSEFKQLSKNLHNSRIK